MKNNDPWNEIEQLIGQEKERALAEFRRLGPDAAPATPDGNGHRPVWRWKTVPLTAAALVAVAVVGLAAFWLAGGFAPRVTVDPLAALLADSMLYRAPETETANPPQPAPDSPFTRQFSAMAELSWLWAHNGNGEESAVLASNIERGDPEAVAVDSEAGLPPGPGSAATPFLSIERGNPEAVREKIRTMIRENAFERLISRFVHTTKEV